MTADIEGEGDSFIFGGKYGIGIAKKSSHEMRYIKRFWNEEGEEGKAERMRANDGGVDLQGRFWSSALCDPDTTSFITGGKSSCYHYLIFKTLRSSNRRRSLQA